MQQATISIQREVDVYVAIGRGRDISKALGFNHTDRTRIEIVLLELTRNLLVHAGGGSIDIEQIEKHQQRGIQITARDTGPGIPDIALAMRDGYSTTNTLGAGLPGVRRLMDEFTIESEVGVGTRVQAIKWLASPRPAGGLRT